MPVSWSVSGGRLNRRALEIAFGATNLMRGGERKLVEASRKYEEAARVETDPEEVMGLLRSAAECSDRAMIPLKAVLLYIEIGDMDKAKEMALESLGTYPLDVPEGVPELRSALLRFADSGYGSDEEKDTTAHVVQQIKLLQDSLTSFVKKLMEDMDPHG